MRIIPPSRTEKGGSSQIAASILPRISSRISIAPISFSSIQVKPVRISLIPGRAAQQLARVRRSLPPAVPYTHRPTSRCMSLISLSLTISSERLTLSPTSSSTAARRLRMATAESRGLSTQDRSRREPIGVFVLSRTHRREPLFSPLLNASVSSRLRRVVQSISMYFPPLNISRWLTWLMSNFCVSSIYFSSAPTAETAPSASRSPASSTSL